MPATIQAVYRQFNPTEPLEAGDPRYVDCNQVRGIPSIFEQLSLPLLDPPPRTLLFSGHIGDGKTTLLKQLAERLEREDHFVAFAQADNLLDLADVDVEDVILLILVAVDQRLRERYGATLQDSRLQQRLKEVWELLNRELSPNKIEVNTLLVKLTADMKVVKGIRQELRARLRMMQGPTFLEVANECLDHARQIIKKNNKQQLVVIFDGFDRMIGRGRTPDVSMEQRLLLDQASRLSSIEVHVIYTASLSLARRQHENLRARYGQSPIIVPLIPVLKRDGQPNPKGLEALKEVIAKRLEQADMTREQAFDTEATVERLCQVNGGYLRGLLALVRAVCAEALAVHSDLPLTTADAEAAIQRLGAQLRDNARPYHKELQAVLDTHTLAEVDDIKQQLLLDQHLVYHYYENGDYWYDVCEPVKEQLSGRSS